MLDLSDFKLNTNAEKVFYYFEKLSAIPRGSGNMKGISDFCEDFAKQFNLKYIRDTADNIVIFKNASDKSENTEPIILQGHLDMVCQKKDGFEIDFSHNGIKIYRDGDFIKADGTTLGADNGIAVAYILAVLASDDISHPPIEAIFTTDEEIGLIGANALDTSVLKSRRMINLDSEAEDVLTVSCAGGRDVVFKLPITRENSNGVKISIGVKGLAGGHSGAEIHKNRVNANKLMGEFLVELKSKSEFKIISVNGGSKSNAIPATCVCEICVQNKDGILQNIRSFENSHKSKIQKNEPNFYIETVIGDNASYDCLSENSTQKITDILSTAPDGVIKMSEEIEDLVETSLNLGILSTETSSIKFHFSLRSNKERELEILTDKILNIGKAIDAETETFGFYPPWEFNPVSPLRELYKNCYRSLNGKEIKVEAIHAGLECAVFSSGIKNLDCISVGPDMHNVHTPNEELNIPSAVRTFNLILNVLEESCKL